MKYHIQGRKKEQLSTKDKAGLVRIDQGVELGGDGKDHMEIRRINDLSLAGVNSQLFQQGLAVGTVTVAAGI